MSARTGGLLPGGKAVASRRPDSGCRTMVTSNPAPCSRLAVSTLIVAAAGVMRVRAWRIWSA
jgi:hypothetical protein